MLAVQAPNESKRPGVQPCPQPDTLTGSQLRGDQRVMLRSRSTVRSSSHHPSTGSNVASSSSRSSATASHRSRRKHGDVIAAGAHRRVRHLVHSEPVRSVSPPQDDNTGCDRLDSLRGSRSNQRRSRFRASRRQRPLPIPAGDVRDDVVGQVVQAPRRHTPTLRATRAEPQRRLRREPAPSCTARVRIRPRRDGWKSETTRRETSSPGCGLSRKMSRGRAQARTAGSRR